MEQNKTKSDVPETDINSEFEAHISLHKFVGHKAATEILRICSEQYYVDKAITKKVNYPSILLIGKDNMGKRTLAKSISNTYALPWRETLGEFLGFQGDTVEDFFLYGQHQVYYIEDADRLTPWTQQTVYKLITQKELYLHNSVEKKTWTYPFAGLLIVSITDPNRFTKSLFDAFSIKLNLQGYSQPERHNILKQRVQFLNWDCSEQALAALSKVIDLGVEMKALALAYNIARSQGERLITEYLVNKAIKLLAATQ